MHFARRQHNATVLPDGTVLVTGGTQGVPGNPHWLAFDNIQQGGPVHTAELWDPATGKWTLMASEDVDRCYHSTALLLPDGRVLSAGGGEYAPGNPALPNQPNPPGDSHKDAQLFTPPYLLKGPRPAIAAAPVEISYGQSFVVSVGAADVIAKGKLDSTRLRDPLLQSESVAQLPHLQPGSEQVDRAGSAQPQRSTARPLHALRIER